MQTSVVCVIASSAAAWLATDSAVTRRASHRAMKTPSMMRPTTAATVITPTASPARARPIAGSRNAIWCTMKPICAISAIANGPATLQNAGLRSAMARVHAPAVRSRDDGCDWDGGGRSIQARVAGTTVSAMIAAAPTMAVAKPNLSIASTSAGVIEDAAEARTVEREADRQGAPLVKPQADDGGDRAGMHRRRAGGEDEIGHE